MEEKDFYKKFYISQIFIKNASSVKWSVLPHLKSQPLGQNFQAQKPVERFSPHQTRINKNTKNAFKTNQILKTSILLNQNAPFYTTLIQSIKSNLKFYA